MLPIKLDARAGYPMFLKMENNVINFVHDDQVRVDDEMILGFKTYKVDEILEERPAKGEHLQREATFYSVQCSVVKDETPKEKK